MIPPAHRPSAILVALAILATVATGAVAQTTDEMGSSTDLEQMLIETRPT